MALTANDTMISATQVIAVTPAATNLPDHRAIWVGGTGNVVVVCANNSQVTIAGVPAGTLIPFTAKQILPASTATQMLLWV